jgi:hypothetical protein
MAIQAIDPVIISRQSKSPDRLWYLAVAEKIKDIWATVCAYCSFSMDWTPKNGSLDSNRYQAAMVRLRSRSIMNSDHLTFLQERHPECQFSLSFTSERGEQSLPEISDQNYVAIPVVITGIVDHIVCFFIDKKNQTIDFFDSKGRTLKDLEDETVLGEGGWKLGQLADAILQRYPCRTLNQNQRKLQKDIHSCALFIWDFLQRRLAKKPKTLAEIQAHPFVADDAGRRKFWQQLDRKKFCERPHEVHDAPVDDPADAGFALVD